MRLMLSVRGTNGLEVIDRLTKAHVDFTPRYLDGTEDVIDVIEVNVLNETSVDPVVELVRNLIHDWFIQE